MTTESSSSLHQFLNVECLNARTSCLVTPDEVSDGPGYEHIRSHIKTVHCERVLHDENVHPVPSQSEVIVFHSEDSYERFKALRQEIYERYSSSQNRLTVSGPKKGYLRAILVTLIRQVGFEKPLNLHLDSEASQNANNVIRYRFKSTGDDDPAFQVPPSWHIRVDRNCTGAFSSAFILSPFSNETNSVSCLLCLSPEAISPLALFIGTHPIPEDVVKAVISAGKFNLFKENYIIFSENSLTIVNTKNLYDSQKSFPIPTDDTIAKCHADFWGKLKTSTEGPNSNPSYFRRYGDYHFLKCIRRDITRVGEFLDSFFSPKETYFADKLDQFYAFDPTHSVPDHPQYRCRCHPGGPCFCGVMLFPYVYVMLMYEAAKFILQDESDRYLYAKCVVQTLCLWFPDKTATWEYNMIHLRRIHFHKLLLVVLQRLAGPAGVSIQTTDPRFESLITSFSSHFVCVTPLEARDRNDQQPTCIDSLVIPEFSTVESPAPDYGPPKLVRVKQNESGFLEMRVWSDDKRARVVTCRIQEANFKYHSNQRGTLAFQDDTTVEGLTRVIFLVVQVDSPFVTAPIELAAKDNEILICFDTKIVVTQNADKVCVWSINHNNHRVERGDGVNGDASFSQCNFVDFWPRTWYHLIDPKHLKNHGECVVKEKAQLNLSLERNLRVLFIESSGSVDLTCEYDRRERVFNLIAPFSLFLKRQLFFVNSEQFVLLWQAFDEERHSHRFHFRIFDKKASPCLRDDETVFPFENRVRFGLNATSVGAICDMIVVKSRYLVIASTRFLITADLKAHEGRKFRDSLVFYPLSGPRQNSCDEPAFPLQSGVFLCQHFNDLCHKNTTEFENKICVSLVTLSSDSNRFLVHISGLIPDPHYCLVQCEVFGSSKDYLHNHTTDDKNRYSRTISNLSDSIGSIAWKIIRGGMNILYEHFHYC